MFGLALLALSLAPVFGSDPRVVAKIPDGCTFVEGSLRFAREGSKCVYVVAKDGKKYPVVGATLGAAYDEVDWPSIDPTGSHTAFRVFERNPHKKVGTFSVLYDGKLIGSDTWVGPLAIDSAKGAVAFWTAHGYSNTADGHLEPGAASLVWGKFKSAKYQYAEFRSPPLFTPDGTLLVTTAARGSGDWNVITVDEKGKDDKHGSGSIFEAAVRPTGHAVAYVFGNLHGDQYWMDRAQQLYVALVSLDEHGIKGAIGVYGEKYDSSGSPVFSADGFHVAFKVLKNGKMGAAIDDQQDVRCEDDFVDELALDPKGSEVAYVACRGCKLDSKNGRQILRGVSATGGKWTVVHGDKRSAEFQRTRFPTWSMEGRQLAFAARHQGKWRVVAGAKQGEPCDEVADLAWTDDGHGVSYGSVLGGEVRWCRLDVE